MRSKLFGRLMSFTLSATVALTSGIPALAYDGGGGDLPEEDVELLEEEVVEEDLEETGAISDAEEIVLDEETEEEVSFAEDEEDAEFETYNDIPIRLTVGSNLTLRRKVGDSYGNAITSGTGYLTSDIDHVFYLVPASTYSITDTAPVTLSYQNFNGVVKHQDGADDETQPGYKIENDTTSYILGEENEDGSVAITIPASFLQEKVLGGMLLKDGSWALHDDDSTEYAVELAINVANAAPGKYPVTVEKGGKYNLNTLVPSAYKAPIAGDYSLQLAGNNGIINGGDKATIAAGGIQATDIKLEVIKPDGTIDKSYSAVEASFAADGSGLLPGMTYDVDGAGATDAVPGTGKVILADASSWGISGSATLTGSPSPITKTLYVANNVITYAASNHYTIKITLGKDEHQIKKYTLTATDTDLIKFTVTGTTWDKDNKTFVAYGEATADDLTVAPSVKKAANAQTGVDPSGFRKIGKAYYKVAGHEEVELSNPYTIDDTALTGNVTVTAYTTETVLGPTTEPAEYSIFNADGSEFDYTAHEDVKTGSAYSFTIATKPGYALADENAVTYRLGNGTRDLAPTTSAKNGETVYTISNITDTITLNIATVSVGQKHNVSVKNTDPAIPSTIKVRSDDTTWTTIDDNPGTTQALATDGEILYFQVTPSAGNTISSVSYTIGESGTKTSAIKVNNSIYRTQAGVTDDIVIEATEVAVFNAYGPRNSKAKVYVTIEGKEVELDPTVGTEIRANTSLYFRVETTASNVEIDDFKPAVDGMQISYYAAASRNGSEDYTSGTQVNITDAGNGSLNSSVVTNNIFFVVSTVTNHEYGKDFVAYFNGTPNNYVKDSVNEKATELLGQSLTLAQFEDETLSVDFYPSTKIVMDGNKLSPAPATSPANPSALTPDAVNWEVVKDEAAKGQIADFTDGDSKLYTYYDSNPSGSTIYKPFKTGTDSIVATATKRDGAYNTDSYTATLPLTVNEAYTDYQIKVVADAAANWPSVAGNDAADATEITTYNKAGSLDPFFTVEGKSGRTGKWVDLGNILYSAGTVTSAIDSIKWSATPDQTGAVAALYTLATGGDEQATISSAAVLSDDISDIEVTAKITLFDGTKVTKKTNIKYVDKTLGYIVVPKVSVKNGSEYLGQTEVADGEGSDAGIALQKSGLMSEATVSYRVFEKTALGSAITAANLDTEYEIATELAKANPRVKEVTNVVFADDTAIINGYGTADTSDFNAFGKTSDFYSKKYATVSGANGTYTIKAGLKTGIDKTNSNAIIYAAFAPTLTVNGVIVPSAPVYFTVNDSFAATDLIFVLTDSENTYKDDKNQTVVTVQKLTGYLTEYTDVQYLSGGVETGRVRPGVIAGSKIKLPTKEQLATTTASNRVLVGFTSGGNHYAPGDEFTVPTATTTTITAQWEDKYVLEGIYNKNNKEIDEDGVVTYGALVAGWDGSNDQAGTISATGTIPLIGKVRTATVMLSETALAADALLPADDQQYDGMSAGQIIYSDAYVEEGISVEYAAGATTDEKAALTISSNKRVLTGVSPIASVPLVVKYTVGTDVFKMQTTTTPFTGAASFAVTDAPAYVITKPTSIPNYYVGQIEEALNVTVKKNGGNHGLAKSDVVITSTNSSVLKVEVGTPSGDNVPLLLTPLATGTATITMGIKDSQGVEAAETKSFDVTVKDEGFRFVFYAEDGKTKLTSLDVHAGATDKFIIRAEKNGVAVSDIVSWAFTGDGEVIGDGVNPVGSPIAAPSALNEDDGYGKIVTVTAANVLSSEGKVIATMNSATVSNYKAEIPVRTYRTVTFAEKLGGTFGDPGDVKEILVNGKAYTDVKGDPIPYPVKVFEEDLNADGEVKIAVDNISATYTQSTTEAKSFSGWTATASLPAVTVPTKTGEFLFAMNTDRVINANFADADVTFEGITEGRTIVLDQTDKNALFEQFNLRVEPYNSSKGIKVIPEKKGFYTLVSGEPTSITPYTPIAATSVPTAGVAIVDTTVTQQRRVDKFYIGVVENTAGYTDVTVAAGDYKKTFKLVSVGADFADPTDVAVDEILRYVDYDPAKGAYTVTLDARNVKAEAGGHQVNQRVFFDEEGLPFRTGVIKLTNGDGKSYLVDKYLLVYGETNGAFRTVEGKKYFVDANGVATVGTLATTSDGKTYLFREDGSMVQYLDKDVVNGKILVGGTEYEIASDDTATVADVRYAPTVKFSEWPESWKKGSSYPTITYTVSYTSAKQGKTVEDKTEYLATVTSDPTTIDDSTKKVTFTATATLTGFWADKDGTKAAADVKDDKTYLFLDGSDESEEVIEISDEESDIAIAGLKDEYDYTGGKIIPVFRVYDGATELAKGADYTVSIKDNKNVGTATITIVGKGNYTGKSLTASFKIVDRRAELTTEEIAALDEIKGVKLDVKKYVYTGKPIYPSSITIKDASGSKTYTYDEDAEKYLSGSDEPNAVITVSNNINAGTAKITVTGKDNAKGKATSKSASFTITKAPLVLGKDGKDLEVALDPTEMQWQAKGAEPTATATWNGEELLQNQDFTVKYVDNKKIGTASVTITGKGNFSGSVKAAATFTVAALDLEAADPQFEIVATTAAAGVKATAVKATVLDAKGNVIPAGKYKVTVKDETGAVVTGKLEGEKPYTIEISKKNDKVTEINDKVASIDVTTGLDFAKAKTAFKVKKYTKYYTGNPVVFEDDDDFNAAVAVTYKGTALTLGEDFEIVGYTNNVKKGNMTVTLAGKGKYSGTKTFKVKISAKKLTK
ncbi:hypothetical protein [Butyrivibrio sp. AE3009]|uniref:hypothetical protein n=1 Tax=Butyrivibrio sp. AE3009 TaxID=1280666 RepID=UPI0003B77D48|nr:hypothetical protein [Butyrivibrio sp. AE3009]